MKYLFIPIYVFIVTIGLASFNYKPLSKALAIVPADSLTLQKAEKVIAGADSLIPKASNLKSIFENYKLKAHGCPKALNEANDGLDMATKAVSDCTEAKKLIDKAHKSKKSSDAEKLILKAERLVHNAKYFIQQAEDRKHITEFELKGCRG